MIVGGNVYKQSLKLVPDSVFLRVGRTPNSAIE